MSKEKEIPNMIKEMPIILIRRIIFQTWYLRQQIMNGMIEQDFYLMYLISLYISIKIKIFKDTYSILITRVMGMQCMHVVLHNYVFTADSFQEVRQTIIYNRNVKNLVYIK